MCIRDREIIVKNRLNRNLARFIASALDKTNRDIYVFGFNLTTRTITLIGTDGNLRRFEGPNPATKAEENGVFAIAYGTGSIQETITDQILETTSYYVICNYWDVIEETNQTKILVASHHNPLKNMNCYEVCLARATSFETPEQAGFAIFSRVTFSTPLILFEGENRFDGWEIIFNNKFSKWFVKVFEAALHIKSLYLKDINGSMFTTNRMTPLNGSPKIRLGDGSATPSPDDYGLAGTELAVVDATLSLTEDAENNILRISAWNTLTPSSDLQVNEIALFTSVKDRDGNNHEILVARDVFPTTQTLHAGIPYTIGIDLIF